MLGPAYARSSHLRASRLETQLAQAKLEALKMQLHPHFLFNTLNAISALEAEDSERAQRMLARLADFMRLTLDNSGVQEAPLEREMDFLSRYLEIERIRFPEKLTVRIDLSPETLDARIPNLILQPIVENAIRHGIAAQRGPGRIEISSRKQNGSLFLRVRDTGPGLRKEAIAEGIGLQNTRACLQQLYGSASRLTLEDADGGGLAVTIEIPYDAMIIRTLIVDDEPLARTAVRNVVRRHPDVSIAGECESGAEAIAAIQSLSPDLVFLDVQMPEVSGFGVLGALDPERLPIVVFVTAYDQYALRAFDVHALDYVLKPFDRERLEAALDRARRRLQHPASDSNCPPGWSVSSSGLKAACSSSARPKSTGSRRKATMSTFTA